MLSGKKVINNNLYILKIDSPKNISLNIRQFNYRAGNIRHIYRPIATILVHILDFTQTLEILYM